MTNGQAPEPEEGDPAPQAKPAATAKAAKGRKATATARATLDEQGDPIPF